MALVEVANCKRRFPGETEDFFFPTKIRTEGVGSRTVEFIPGTEELVDESRLDENRLVR